MKLYFLSINRVSGQALLAGRTSLMDLIVRFVDDITVVLNATLPGMKFAEGRIEIDKEKEKNDEEMEDDVRTMELVQNIANSLDSQIKVSFYVPTNHPDKMVPILDVKASLTGKNKITYKFYQKPKRNRMRILMSTAMSNRQMMKIQTQECFLRLHNTLEDVTTVEKVEILDKFAEDLKLSGYNEEKRKDILANGVKTFENLKLKEKEGLRPFYRNSSFNKEDRKEAKKDKNKSWFKSKGKAENIQTVMFVELTPRGELVKKLRETEEKFKIDNNKRVKFVEKTGIKLINILQRKDPFKKNCEKKDCVPCQFVQETGGTKLTKCRKKT